MNLILELNLFVFIVYNGFSVFLYIVQYVIIQGFVKIYFILLIYFYFILIVIWNLEDQKIENSNKYVFIIVIGIFFNIVGVDYLSYVLFVVK